jgi:ComF family protein
MLARVLSDVASLVYPQRCVSCGESAEAESPAFCEGCDANLGVLCEEPACPRCAVPMAAGAACAQCGGKGIYPFGTIVALSPFRDPVRSLVHQMKFHHRWPVAEILADRAVSIPRIRRVLEETDVLVPVPLHWARQISRGYNQADALARRLRVHGRNIALRHPLARVRNTAAQTTIHSIVDRVANLRNAFELVDGKGLKGKRVTLVDDVMTTASTLKAAARALKGAECGELKAIVIAVADPRRRDFQTA